MAGKHLSAIEKRQMDQDYLASNPLNESKTKLCERLASTFGVSSPTVRRLAKAGNWDARRLVATNATPEVIAEQVRRGTVEVNLLDLVGTALNEAAATAKTTPPKSSEGMYRTFATLADLWLRLNPQTVDDVIDAMERTGVTPKAIAQRLRERLGST